MTCFNHTTSWTNSRVERLNDGLTSVRPASPPLARCGLFTNLDFHHTDIKYMVPQKSAIHE